MTTKKAIKIAHNFVLEYGRIQDIEAIYYLTDIAQRFEGAVQVSRGEVVGYNNSFDFFNENKVYAIPKEQDNV